MLLIDRYNSLRASGMSVNDSILHGSLDRLNPILMTALSSGLALIPLALGGELPVMKFKVLWPKLSWEDF